MKSWHERCLQPCLFLCSIRQPFLRPDRALLPSPPRADAVKVGRRANHATMSDFARPHLGRWRARRQACMGRAEDDQTIGHREVGARNALSAKPTMCTRMHRSQFPFRTSLQRVGMGTGTRTPLVLPPQPSLVRPQRSFLHPGRSKPTLARAAAVKTGRRSLGATRSDAGRPRLDGREHGSTLDRLGAKPGRLNTAHQTT